MVHIDTMKKEIVNLKVYKHTRTKLKILAAQLGIPMVELLERFVSDEQKSQNKIMPKQ